jgi:hypothetical protein
VVNLRREASLKTKVKYPAILLLISIVLPSACELNLVLGLPQTPTPTNTPEPILTPNPTTVVQPCVEPPEGLLSWWPGDGNANDIQGNNDGSLLDGATFAPGLVGRAFSFDGIGQVVAPVTGLPIDDSDRTMDLWVKVNVFYEGEAFFAAYGKFDAPDQAYYLGTAGKTLFFSQWGQNIWGPELVPGRWYHVAVTNAGTLVTLYLDGKVVNSGNLRITTPGRTHLFIGNLPGDSSKQVNGLIDEVDIFNQALPAAEIKSIFDAGSNGKCKYPIAK